MANQETGRELRRGAVEMTVAMLISGTIGWLVVASGQSPQNVVFVRCALGAPTLALICYALGLIRRDALSWRTLGLAAAGVNFGWRIVPTRRSLAAARTDGL